MSKHKTLFLQQEQQKAPNKSSSTPRQSGLVPTSNTGWQTNGKKSFSFKDLPQHETQSAIDSKMVAACPGWLAGSLGPEPCTTSPQRWWYPFSECTQNSGGGAVLLDGIVAHPFWLRMTILNSCACGISNFGGTG